MLLVHSTLDDNNRAHNWIMKFDADQEGVAIKNIAQLAADPAQPFSWLDAARCNEAITRMLKRKT